ncbi:hypothetical protein OPQ81_000842 [Rhizoctonia solani]|nr:hypothetical protein OPQ81_000842 [Rhizoctonia solani]
MSESVQEQLANLPKEHDDNSSSDDGDESEEDITANHEPLGGKQIPKPTNNQSAAGKSWIFKIDINLQHPLPLDIQSNNDPDVPNDSMFDDTSELDALGMDADVTRGFVIQYYWVDFELQQKVRKEENIKGKDTSKGKKAKNTPVCSLCLEMTTQWDNLSKFTLQSNLE